MARRRLVFIFIVVAIAALLAWWAVRQNYFRTLVAAPVRLTPVSFADLPRWRDSDPRPALAAFARSCAVLVNKPPSAAMGGIGYAGMVSDWLPACRALPHSQASAARARRFFESWAVPVAVSAGDELDGTFTGYYEPEIHASRTAHGAFETPVYATPDNLLTVDLGQFRDDLAGQHITGCANGHKLLRCPSRGQIDANGMKQAKVLFYADDPISVFFLHIQGSGRVRLDDGSVERVAYDAQNGEAYTPIGRTLIAEGALPADGMSMQVLRRWLSEHPNDAHRVMETDKSFIFFREAPIGDDTLGSNGSEGVPLTPGASLAVDMRIHPLGAPIFVAAMRPDAQLGKSDHDFDQLMVAQDSGGAIKGAVRGDVFWGFGPDAEAIAGRMKSSGKLYVLLPKQLAAELGPSKDFAAP